MKLRRDKGTIQRSGERWGAHADAGGCGGSGRGPSFPRSSCSSGEAAVGSRGSSGCTGSPERPSCSFCLYRGRLFSLQICKTLFAEKPELHDCISHLLNRFVSPAKAMAAPAPTFWRAWKQLRRKLASQLGAVNREGEKGDGKGLADAP